ncbi:hypothetical protein ACI79C_12410 [Geodermatophilus sp. SYSU D00697]
MADRVVDVLERADVLPAHRHRHTAGGQQSPARALEAEWPQLRRGPVDRHVEPPGDLHLGGRDVPRLDEGRPPTDPVAEGVEQVGAVQQLGRDRPARAIGHDDDPQPTPHVRPGSLRHQRQVVVHRGRVRFARPDEDQPATRDAVQDQDGDQVPVLQRRDAVDVVRQQ